MEKFDLIDKNRIPLGKTLERGNTNILEGEYRQVIHIAIFNSSNQMLIQQRQPTKRLFPNLWDISVGGSVVSGETPCDAAERELFEELGVKIDFSNYRPILTSNFYAGFDDYFIVNKDIKLEDLKLQIEEVKDAKWATLYEILDMIDKRIFIPYNKNFIRLLFDLKAEDGDILAK